MKQNYYLALDTAERRLIIESLNNLRSRLIAAGRFSYTINIQHLLSLVKLLNPRRIHRNVRL